MLTLEVAVIRCYLAVNAANCVYPSSVKVLVAALSSFTIYAGLYLAYVSALVYQDVPYSYMIEHCSRSLTKMRPISKGALLSLQIPNVLNVVTMIVDLVLVQFLRKNSLKDIQNQITLGAIIPPDANGGKFGEFDFKEFFLKMGHPRPLFVYFRSFETIYKMKTVDFSGIRTRLVAVECEHADDLATTTAH